MNTNLWLTLHLILLQTCRLNTFITKYDLIANQTVLRREEPIYFFEGNSANHSRLYDVEVMFNSFNTDFHLLLNEDAEFKSILIEHGDSGRNDWHKQLTVRFYEGVLRDAPSSLVIGFLFNGVFSGVIKNGSKLYFLERASQLFRDYKNSRSVLIYGDEDMSYPVNMETKMSELFRSSSVLKMKNSTIKYYSYQTKPDKSAFSAAYKRLLKSYVPFHNKSLRFNINKTPTSAKNEDLVCEIEIIADHTYYKFQSESIDQTAAQMYLHGKFADVIFRTTDFDDDHDPDQIRILTKKIVIKTHPTNKNYPMAKIDNILPYLIAFSSMRNNYCLSISICARPQTDNVLGKSFIALPHLTWRPGGICQPLVYNPGRGIKSYNKAVITTVDKNNNALPIGISLFALTHELGHAFGSSHDALHNVRCSPGRKRGYYIMHSEVSNGNYSLNWMFSPCSRRHINAVLKTKARTCLKTSTPQTCGNGVREGIEECDCGTSASCNLTDLCCSPGDAKLPEKGCTIRRALGYSCSHREDPCCSKSCSVTNQTTIVCLGDYDRCLVSICDGSSATCLNPEIVLNGSRTSNSSCWNEQLEEGLICYNDVSCISASKPSVRVLKSDVHYYSTVGSPCFVAGYRCTDKESMQRRFPANAEKSTKKHYFKSRIRFLLIPLIIISICMCFGCCACWWSYLSPSCDRVIHHD